ncbi:MAG: GumC family protein, partial [Devosiaceae bacterium]|nr:GumC family protein [Devosiaceae bacterium]
AAIASQVEIIQSRTLVQEVFVEQGYISDPEFAKTRMLSVVFGLFSPPKPATQAQIFNNFWKRLNVERQGLTYVINVSFSSQDAQKSAQVVNAVIEAYMGSQVDEKSDANAQVSILLSNQMNGLRAELTQKEAAVEAFKEAHGILSVGAGGTLLQSQIEQLSAQLVVARQQARTANNRHQQVASINAMSAPLATLFELLPDTNSGSLRASYTQSSLELSSLQASLGPRHPNFQIAAAELGRLENLIRSEALTVLTQIASEMELAQTNVNNAELELMTLSAQNSVSNQNQVELRNLERQAQATRQVLEQLTSREKETGQLENLQRSNARVISQAVAPISATWPKSTLLLAIAAFFGVALGTSVALYLGPKNPNKVTPELQAHSAGNGFDNQPKHISNPAHQPRERKHFGLRKNAPAYHSNQEEVFNPDRNEKMGQDIQNASPDFANSHRPTSANLWARRAAGEPYEAPANANSSAPLQSTYRASRQSPHNNVTQTQITREGFVSELKRRLEQNGSQ